MASPLYILRASTSCTARFLADNFTDAVCSSVSDRGLLENLFAVVAGSANLAVVVQNYTPQRSSNAALRISVPSGH
jgi:hypothetical protein